MAIDPFGESDLFDATGSDMDLLQAMRGRGGANLSQASSPAAQELAARQRAMQERAIAQQAARRSSPFATNAPMMNHGASGAYHAAIGSAQQANVLQDMISRTMAAHQDENDSRVSQAREMRRMMHEQELERMRQDTERMKIDALLQRLGGNVKTGPYAQLSPGQTHVFRGGSISYV